MPVATGNQDKPVAVIGLETAYGAPSRAGFGSAVFYEPLPATGDLEQAAIEKYRYFVGELWERFGADAWMSSWKEVYARPAGYRPDTVAELSAITDRDAALSTPMILDNLDGAAQARAALAAVFDDPAVTEFRVFTLGDGGAMSGLLIAGSLPDSGVAIFLVFLMD